MGSDTDRKPSSRNKSSSNNNSSNTNKFIGGCAEMQGNIYDYKPGAYSGTDEYERTTTALINHCCSTLPESSALRYCLKELTKKIFPKPIMAASIPPKDDKSLPTSTQQEVVEFKEELREQKGSTKRLEESLNKTYSIAVGQATTAILAKIEESSDWAAVSSASDIIGLLKIIRKIAHNTEDQTNPTLSLLQATQRLYNLKQGDNQTPENYKTQFDNMHEVVTTMGGHLSQPPTLHTVSKDKYQKSYDDITPTQQQVVSELAEEMTCAILFIHNSNGKRSFQLKNKLYNDYVQGQTDSYPDNMNAAYQMLKQYRSINVTIDIPPEQARSFTTKGKYTNKHSDSDSNRSTDLHPKWEHYRCKFCGEKGHPPYATYCKAIRAIQKDPELLDKIKKASHNASDSDNSQSNGSKSKKPKKSKSQTESTKTKKAAIAAFQKTQHKQFTQMMNQLNDSPSDSSDCYSSDSESTEGHGFFQTYEVKRAPKYRSAQKHRSVHIPKHTAISDQYYDTQSESDSAISQQQDERWIKVTNRKSPKTIPIFNR
jgi:hypothetical protein